MPTLAEVLNHPAISVFLGTVPLLMTIWWGLMSNNQALKAITENLKVLNDRVARVDTKVDDLGKKVNEIDVRLARVETRLELPRLVTGD
jgi:hypothetical protein